MNNNKILLSVIVPVYNMEEHLRGCVDSLVEAKTEALEIILVDDGSSDSSPAICDDCKRRHGNIAVIHKENGGAASARNAGIAAARGEYLTFVDSDDTVTPGYFEMISAHFTGRDDIIVFPITIDYTETNDSRCQEFSKLQSATAADALRALENGGAFNMPCSKVYRREMLAQQPETRFEPHTEPGEDLLFNCACFVKAQKVTLAEESFYHWIRRGEDTLSNRFRRDLTQKNMMFIERRKLLYRALSMDETDFPLLAKGNLEYIFNCVPNMYRGKNKFPRGERLAFYKGILKSADVKKWMAAAPADTSLQKQFRRVYKTKSAFMMDLYYSTAMWMRRRFDRQWQIIRKQMMKKTK